MPLPGDDELAAGASEVPRDSCATAEPHFFEFVAARLAHVFGTGGGAGAGAGAGWEGAAGAGWTGASEGADGGAGEAAGAGDSTAGVGSGSGVGDFSAGAEAGASGVSCSVCKCPFVWGSATGDSWTAGTSSAGGAEGVGEAVCTGSATGISAAREAGCGCAGDKVGAASC